jgi:hypothetical protein
MGRCPGALSSFARVNVFLLQVYWEKSVWTSCKRLIFADESPIINRDEVKKHHVND